MPKDVPLGEGYCGDALFSSFPGQYRDSEQDAAGRAFLNQFPGNASGRPNYVDPDSGRQMVLQNIAGVGQVVVPVEHAMAAVVPVDHTMAQVYPSDHVMAGIGDLGDDDPRTAHGHGKWHAEMVRALDASAQMTSAREQLTVALTHVAAHALQRCVQKVKRGLLRTEEQCLAFIQKAITAAAQRFNDLVKTVAAAVSGKVADQARSLVRTALASAPRRAGQGDWPGSMMGLGDDVLDSVVQKAAETQAKHKALIDQLGKATTTESRRPISDQLGTLKQQWTFWGLQAVGVQFPYQLDRTNPAQAIVLAVRDDIAETQSLIEQNRAQEALAKEIKDVWAQSADLGLPSKPNILPDIGKYALYAALAVGGVVALPHILKIFGVGS